MRNRIARLFIIKTRFEAYTVIYALAVGGVGRGLHYLDQFPGAGGYLLFLACTGTVFMAGAKILDGVPRRRAEVARTATDRRQGDRRQVERRQAVRPTADRRTAAYA